MPEDPDIKAAKEVYATLPEEQRTAIEQMVAQGHKRIFAMRSIIEQDRARLEQGIAEKTEPRSLKEKIGAYQLGGAQMLGFGLSDEARGVGAAVAAPFRGRDIIPEYERARDEQRAELEAAASRNPVATGAGEIASVLGGAVSGGGSAAQAAKAMALRPAQVLGRGVATGSATGVVGGFGAGEGLEDTLKQMGKGLVFGGGLGLIGAAVPALRLRRTMPKPAPAAPAGGGVGAGVREAVEAAGGLGNIAKRQVIKKIPIVGDELADIWAPKPKAPATPPTPAPAPAAEPPAGPFKMPAPPREARVSPIPEPTAVKVTPEMVVESGPNTAMRIQKIGEENTWVARALKHGASPEAIAKGGGLPVEDVQALARAQRTSPDAGPVAADAPPPAPPPEPPAPSPFARAKPPSAQPAQPPAAPAKPFDPSQPVGFENLPPGMSAKRWSALTGQAEPAAAPFLSTPSPRPSAPPSEATAAGRVPAAPKEPSPVEIRDASIEKFDAVRRARQALRGTAQTIGEQSPTWLNDVLDEIRTKPGIRPEEIKRVTDRMIAEGYDPHLIQQAIAARRGQELEGLADISRLTGKTMKENLAAQAIASGAKTADEIAEMTGLNLAEVELLTGRHDVLVPRGVPKPEPTRPTPINPAPLDESGERVFSPAYKEIFGEPYRSSKLTAEERLARLPPGVGEGQMKEILRLRSGMGSEGVPLKPQQIAERLKIPPPVVRFILKERGENLPRISLMKGGPEAPAFDEGAKVMGRGAIPGNVQRIKLLQNDKAGLAKFLDELRAAGWTQAQIDGMMSQATSPAPLKVRKRKPPE